MLVKKLVLARTLLLMILLVLMAVAVSCHTPAGRTPGDVVDDTTITSQVKAKLFDSTELSGFAISVDTFERVVTLTGAVDTEYQKQLAEKIARSVSEVRGVNNLLVNK